MARKFLGIIAIITILVILVAIVWRIFSDRLVKAALTPTVSFAESPLDNPPDPALDSGWIARPGMEPNPARWTPAGHSAAPRPQALAFFVPPTGFLGRDRWNAPLDDAETRERLDRFTQTQASVFNGIAEIWAPNYRQATYGAFLSPGPDAVAALGVAFQDVRAAFDAFLAANPGDRPIILAGHSQGALHLLHLLGSLPDDVRQRIVAVYAVGWSVALPDDPQRAGFPACTRREQHGCLISWQTYAADGELAAAMAALETVPALDGQPLGDRNLLCVNPLTGGAEAASAETNAGTLIDDALQPHRTGARCDDRGLLLIEPTPRDIGPFVLPGGNFHVYDYQLFWANVRADVEARFASFSAAAAPALAD